MSNAGENCTTVMSLSSSSAASFSTVTVCASTDSSVDDVSSSLSPTAQPVAKSASTDMVVSPTSPSSSSPPVWNGFAGRALPKIFSWP